MMHVRKNGRHPLDPFCVILPTYNNQILEIKMQLKVNHYKDDNIQ